MSHGISRGANNYLPVSRMIYRVTARFRIETAVELRRRLDDGSIAAQQPDGQEIVASLHRAVVTGTDEVRWSEMCFCDPPLAHERATVLDHYFDGINPEPIKDYERYVGEPFVEYLQKLQEDNSRRIVGRPPPA